MRDGLQDDDVQVGVEAAVLVQQRQADGVTEKGFIKNNLPNSYQ